MNELEEKPPSGSEPSQELAPFLFAPGELPERPDLVTMVKQGAHRFTGERLSRDKELCRAVCADMLLGLSNRAIASKYGVSRNSVVQIECVMRESGELEGVKTHVLKQLDRVISLGLDEWAHALETGKIAAGSIPIPVLAALDKRVQLAAGVVLGTGRTEKELSVDDLQAAWEKIKSAGPPIDVKSPPLEELSADQAEQPLEISRLTVNDTVLDTIPALSDPLRPTSGFPWPPHPPPPDPDPTEPSPAGPPVPAPTPERPPAGAPEPVPPRAPDGGGGAPEPRPGGGS